MSAEKYTQDDSGIAAARQLAHRTANMLNYLRHTFGVDDIQMSYVDAFLNVGARHNMSVQELSETIEMSRSTASRIVSFFSTGIQEYSQTELGEGIFHCFDDPMDIRRKMVSLSDYGQQVLETALDIQNGRTSYEKIILSAEERAKRRAQRLEMKATARKS